MNADAALKSDSNPLSLQEQELLLRSGSIQRVRDLPPLPNQAERRRRVFGDKVMPNMVLLARESESA